jgi:hypothetical protein
VLKEMQFGTALALTPVTQRSKISAALESAACELFVGPIDPEMLKL